MAKRTVANRPAQRGRASARSIIRQGPAPTWHKGLDFIVEAPKFYDRMKVDLRESVGKGKNKKARKVSVCGWIAVTEARRDGSLRIKRHWVSNKAELQELRSSLKYGRGKLLEVAPAAAIRKGYKQAKESFVYDDTFAQGLNVTTGSSLRPNDEYHPLLAGPFHKQMYLYDYLDMHSKAFEQLNHNPLARQGVNVITNYVCGKGISVIFRNSECQKNWDDFEKRNKYQMFMRTCSDTLTWAGEFMTQKVVEDGLPWVRHIDPSTIWEIVTVPTDITKVLYYHQQYPTQYQLVYQHTDIVSEYVFNDISPSEVMHVKINAAPGEKRGRSDFLPVMGDLKRFKDYYDAKVIKAQVSASFAVRKTIDGSDADVESLANDDDLNSIPPPGSVIFENKMVTTDFLETANEGRGTDNVGESLRSIIATGFGLGPEMLGVGGAASVQATAITKAEPAYMKFNMRQMILEGNVSDTADWVTEIGMLNGRVGKTQVRKAALGKIRSALSQMDMGAVVREAWALLRGRDIPEPTDTSFDVISPEILTEDRTEKLTHVQNAGAIGSFTHRRVSEITAQELNQRDYNYDEEMEEREEEAMKASTTLYQQTSIPFVTVGGQGPQPGDQAPGSSSERGKVKDRSKEK